MHAKLEIRNAHARRTYRLMDNDHDGVVSAAGTHSQTPAIELNFRRLVMCT